MSRSLTISQLLIVGCLIIWTACDNKVTVKPNYGERFIRYFGTDGDQFARNLKVATDGYLILGESTTNTGKKIFLVKTDFFGNQLWASTYNQDDEYDYNASGIEELQNGNSIISATIEHQDSTWAYLMIVDAAGTQIDSRIIGKDSRLNNASVVKETSNNDIILIGTSLNDSADVDQPGIYAWRTFPNSLDLRPTSEWRRNFQQSYLSRGTSFVELKVGNLLPRYSFLATKTNVNGNTDVIAFQLDENGNPITQKTLIATANNDEAVAMVQRAGELAFLNETQAGSVSSYQIVIATASLDVHTQVQINPGRVVNLDGMALSGNDFLISGSEIDPVSGSNIYLAKIGLGGVKWEQVFGSLNLDEGSKGLSETADGGVIFAGTVQFDNQFKIMLIKTDALGRINEPEN